MKLNHSQQNTACLCNEKNYLAGLHIAYISRLPHFKSWPSTHECRGSGMGTQLTTAAPNIVLNSSACYHSFATLMTISFNVASYNGNYLFYITCFVAQKSSLFWGR